jgi:hypothetical protein
MTMIYDNSFKQKRSLGALRKAPKTKQKSPDATGTMKLQRHTLQMLNKQLDETDGDQIICNLAGWRNEDHSGRYLTVELSPRFVSRRHVEEQPQDIFDCFRAEQEELH